MVCLALIFSIQRKPKKGPFQPSFNIIYMTYFRLQASSRLCLAFQLAADLRVLVLSAGHVRVEVGARSDKGFLALSLLRLKTENNI